MTARGRRLALASCLLASSPAVHGFVPLHRRAGPSATASRRSPGRTSPLSISTKDDVDVDADAVIDVTGVPLTNGVREPHTDGDVASAIVHADKESPVDADLDPRSEAAERAADAVLSSVEDFRRLSEASMAEIESIAGSFGSPEDIQREAADSFQTVLDELKEIQQKQIDGVMRAAVDVERMLEDVNFDLAFGDSPLGELGKPVSAETAQASLLRPGQDPKDLVNGRMKSKEIMKYWKIAPLYAGISLSVRWLNKCLTLPLIPLQIAYRAVPPGFPGKPRSVRKDWAPGDMRTAELMQEKWKKSATTGTFRRSAEIWGHALTFVAKEKRLQLKLDRGKMTPDEFSVARTELGKEATQILLKLGPTFIKVGQLLSTRIDIVPKEYIETLRLLQDQVPPFSGELAAEIIERELGKPVLEIFDTFNYTSLAAASLGQVHVATKGKKTFAVKVQRQYLRELFAVDLKNLRQLAGFLDATDPKAEGSLLDQNCQRDWVSIYEESARLLYEEIDYVNEVKNCQLFAENFDKPRFSHIKVPDTYPEMSTEKVMTMEFCPGIKITDKEALVKAGIDPVDIGVKSAQLFLESLCRNGFFHCDPHPGNLAVRKAGPAGQATIIVYDFGMMDFFNQNQRKGFIDFIFAFYENDVRGALDALEVLGILRSGPDVDRIAVERVGKDFMDRFQETLRNDGDWDGQMSEEEKKKANRARRARLGEEFLTMNTDVPFVFPPTFTFVFRAFMSLDGIGKSLDPKYDMTRIARPYLKELLDLKDGSAAKTVALKLLQRVGLRPIDVENAVTQPRKTAYIATVNQRLERGEFKLRVRALEAERSLARADIVQSNTFKATLAGLFLNAALAMTAVGGGASLRALSKVCFVAGTVFGVQVPLGMRKLKTVDDNYSKFNVKR